MDADHEHEQRAVFYGDMRVTSDRRKGTCLFWVRAEYLPCTRDRPVARFSPALYFTYRWYPTPLLASTCPHSMRILFRSGEHASRKSSPGDVRQCRPQSRVEKSMMSEEKKGAR